MGVSPCAERPRRARWALDGRARARAVKGGDLAARAQRGDVLARTPSRVGLAESGSARVRLEGGGRGAVAEGGAHRHARLASTPAAPHPPSCNRSRQHDEPAQEGGLAACALGVG